MAGEEPAAANVPTKVCPHCSVQSQTASDKCPHCGKSYKVKVRRRGGCLRIFLGIVGLIVVIAIIAAVAGNGKSKPVKASDVVQRVTGTFVRGGCLGCQNTAKIRTSNVYCGWDGKDVIVHVVFGNTSSEVLKVEWHPSYLIRNGTSHGTGLTSIKDTTLQPGQTLEVFQREKPAGTSAGTPIARCYPSFFNVQAG